MEKNSNKWLIITNVILIILVICLMGIICFKEFGGSDSSNEKENSTKTTTEAKKKVSNENKIMNIEDFPTTSDNKEYDFMRVVFGDSEDYVFSSADHKLDVVDFNFKCSSYENDFGEISEECSTVDVLVNNNKISYISIGWDYSYAFITADYIITQEVYAGGSIGNMNIYDHNGKLIKKIEHSAEYYFDNQGEMIDTSMKVVDNKLYYVVAVDPKTCGETNELDFKYIDLLNDLDEYSIQKFSAKTCDYE